MFDDFDDFEMDLDGHKKTAIYQKALELFHLGFPLMDLIVDDLDNINFKPHVWILEEIDDEKNEEISRFMAEDMVNSVQENLMILTSKAASAYGARYDLKMENAALMRKAAREIYLACGSLATLVDERQVGYLEIIRNEIEAYRLLFAEWVKGFDPWDYDIDTWGLFNPPGVNYDDPDPDSDIPFEGPDI